SDAGLTRSGSALGTPEYMSPEQASGAIEVDARTDVYALGCVVYEMLAGHPPFTGKTPQEILSRHAMDLVPKLAAARADVPEAIEAALRRALAKSPSDRFATATDFTDAVSDAPT